MSLRRRLRVLAVCLVLQAGVVSGVPMTPDQIRELMNDMNQPKLAHVLPAADDGSADPPASDSQMKETLNGRLKSHRIRVPRNRLRRFTERSTPTGR